MKSFRFSKRQNVHRRSSRPTDYKQRKGGSITARINGKHIYRLLSILLLVCAGGIASMLIHQKLCNSDFFRITDITIKGVVHTSKNEILQQSGIDIHTNLLAMDASAVKEKLENHVWVQHAEISRNWPNQLTITVEERKPIALLNTKNGFFYLDKHGIKITHAKVPGDLDFPVITGINDDTMTARSNEVKPSVPDNALIFLRYAGRGNPILPKQNISEIHITEKGGMVLYLLDHPFPIYLGQEKITDQYYRLVKVLKGLYKKDELSDVAYIDMNYQENKVLVGKVKSG